jgi:N-methylhydantoinase B
MWLTSMIDRAVIPPYGLQGGEPGAPYRITIERADGSRERLGGKDEARLGRGDRVVIETSGGGGYGAADT